MTERPGRKATRVVRCQDDDWFDVDDDDEDDHTRADDRVARLAHQAKAKSPAPSQPVSSSTDGNSEASDLTSLCKNIQDLMALY